MRAPADFRRLEALRAEAFYRPGVDEHAARFGFARALGVALGDVDAFDAGALHQPRPVVAGLGLLDLQADLGGDVEQCLLDEPRHHSGIGAAAAHGGDAARTAAAQIEQAFAQRVVRALRDRKLAVGIKARPRLDHGVDVKDIEILGELDEIDRGGIDREVDDHAATRARFEKRGKRLAVVFLGDRHMDETEVPIVEQTTVFVIRRDHHELGAVEPDVPLQQRQRSPADRAEADHHDRTVEGGVQRPGGVGLGHRIHIRRSF